MALSLRSQLLTRHGFQHGFSLRAGGVSEGPYASLNLGRSVDDQPAAVAENLRRFAVDIGYPAERLYEVRQVHGGHVERARAELDPETFRSREADALISADCAIAVKVADCVSILLADPRSGAVGAAHAGWRGVVSQVVSRTVLALQEDFGAQPEELLAAVFPCIGVESFEVSDEVAEQLVQSVGDRGIVQPRTPRPHVDLARSVQLQLTSAGLVATHIEQVAGDTFGDSARFFSFRRDGGVTGRHLAAILARC